MNGPAIDSAACLPGLAVSGVPLTMTTREIAELTGKEHKNVLADARLMLTALGEAAADFSAAASVAGPNGSIRPVIIMRLPKRETLILVSGYSVKMRAKIIDRWQELEACAPVVPQTLSEALRLAADLADAKAKVEQQLAVAAPGAEALACLADADGLLNPTDAAKVLQVNPKRLFDFMREHAWTYRRAGGRSHIAYQDKIAAGYLTHKVRVLTRDDGSERVCAQVLVTPKGLTKLAAEFGAGCA